MKYTTHQILLLLCLICLIITSCKKKKTGIEGLPEITQEGKGTFGCMVNGQLFLPKGSAIGGNVLQSYYQNVNGTLYFLVSATHQAADGVLGVQIETQDIELQTGIVIPLKIREGASGLASYTDFGGGEYKTYKTNNSIKGELKISRFDLANQIVSGTFWFDAVDENGEKVEVREGRFDMRFIR